MDTKETHKLLSDILRPYDKFLSDIDSIIKSKDENIIINFFSNYVHWNSIFAGCVANLVSRYHLWPYIGDRPSPLTNSHWYNDIVSLGNNHFHSIASYIFAAAEDEYDDKGIKIKDERVAHKDMAWFFLNEVYNFFDTDISTRKISTFTNDINIQTIKGYGVNQPNNVDILFENLGFHIGSEKLAAMEFQRIHDSLKKNMPDLYFHLESKHMPNGISAIDWLKVHGTVEEGHFNNAVIAVQIINNFFISKNRPYHVCMDHLRNGFEEFRSIQYSFFENFARCYK